MLGYLVPQFTEGWPRIKGAARAGACKAVGDVLLDVARSHPKCQILVVCGRTHGDGEVQVLENLRVVTGPAEYGHPRIETIFPAE